MRIQGICTSAAYINQNTPKNIRDHVLEFDVLIKANENNNLY
jgi:hypothetical protein